MDQFTIGEIPDELLVTITARLHSHSTALMRLTGRSGPEHDPLYIGSGTLVSIGHVDGILTAKHVADKLSGPFHLGLVMAREGEEHRFMVDRKALSIFGIGQWKDEEFGPDLSFIVLSDWDDVGTIRASSSFHQLTNDRQEMIANPPDLDVGVWFLCGSPEKLVTQGPSDAGFREVMSLTDFCYAGGVDPGYEKDDFDYLDFPLENGDGSDLLSTYEGVSGGGLWQVTIRRSDDGDLIAGRYLYSGLVFWQGARPDGVRFLRCHGRRSVYEMAYSTVIGKSA